MMSYNIWTSEGCFNQWQTHTHTHTHTRRYIYIYIYIYMQWRQERWSRDRLRHRHWYSPMTDPLISCRSVAVGGFRSQPASGPRSRCLPTISSYPPNRSHWRESRTASAQRRRNNVVNVDERPVDMRESRSRITGLSFHPIDPLHSSPNTVHPGLYSARLFTLLPRLVHGTNVSMTRASKTIRQRRMMINVAVTSWWRHERSCRWEGTRRGGTRRSRDANRCIGSPVWSSAHTTLHYPTLYPT